MKRNGLTKLLFVVGMAAGLIIAGFYSCEKQSIEPQINKAESYKTLDMDNFLPHQIDICGDFTKKRLIRDDDGRTIGEVLVYNDLKYMYVLLHTTQNFFIKKAYMHAGENTRDFPVTDQGGLKYSDFNYAIGGLPFADVRRFKIPLTELRGKSYFSVMAEVKKKRLGAIENAWVEGRDFGTDGMVFLYNRNECLANPAIINQIAENE
jgi:hypothetical protein